MTAEEAEDHHSVQLANLTEPGVDLVSAMTFDGVPERSGWPALRPRPGCR